VVEESSKYLNNLIAKYNCTCAVLSYKAIPHKYRVFSRVSYISAAEIGGKTRDRLQRVLQLIFNDKPTFSIFMIVIVFNKHRS